MKVGVDSVLLGAWADVSRAARILDVGTGTGLLALMLAQRNATASIEAVEIDRTACLQARQNVADSPWPNRIRIICDDFRDFARQGATGYDLIISNPPYFTNSLKPNDARRSLARHNDQLPLPDLLACSARLLAPEGSIAVVLPPTEADLLLHKAIELGLFVQRLLRIRSFPSKIPHRVLIELSQKKTAGAEQVLSIENDTRDDFTPAYKELTQNFYLKF
jgi:tRNA1Val (adenine37-N6)-methyltransferase